MVTLIPAILATNSKQFLEQLDNIKSSSSLEGGWVHIDLMDGELVETKSIDVDELKHFDIPFKKEAHLMVKRPFEWLEKLVLLGFERIIVHIEAEGVAEVLESLKAGDIESGLAINPETDLNQIKPFLHSINVLQIMGVTPGKQGQPFLSSTYDRVKDAVAMFPTVAMDGGVNDQTAAKLVASGASSLVIGSYFEEGDIEEDVEKIWEVLG